MEAFNPAFEWTTHRTRCKQEKEAVIPLQTNTTQTCKCVFKQKEFSIKMSSNNHEKPASAVT